MIVSHGGKAPAPISVVIGLVSTEDGDRILETLQSLHERQGDDTCEVTLADRRKDAVSAEIRARYPQVAIVECDAGTTLPEMRTVAFEASRGAIVAVTEDHCVPAEGWLAQINQAFANGDDKLAAVAGAVWNGVADTGFDWATFICEYSYFSPPVVEGPTNVLPGMNVAYRRSALEATPREKLTSGFWETTVHPYLADQGLTLLSRNAMKMFHCKKFSMGLFFAQRFIYSRYYAGLRFGAGNWPERLVASVASLLLPPLLLFRMTKAAMGKDLAPQFGRALPALAPLVVVWAVGEIWGYLFGPGDALAQIE
jgi:hypothetical protein